MRIVPPSPVSINAEVRSRVSRGSVLVHTGQSQPMTGMPQLVPLPNIVSLSMVVALFLMVTQQPSKLFVKIRVNALRLIENIVFFFRFFLCLRRR